MKHFYKIHRPTENLAIGKDVPATQRSFWISDETYRRMQLAATLCGINVSELLRQVVAQFAEEVLKDAGIADINIK